MVIHTNNFLPAVKYATKQSMRYLCLASLLVLVVSCGGGAGITSNSGDQNQGGGDNSGPILRTSSDTTTITWDEMVFDGNGTSEKAVNYRVLYSSERGARPEEMVVTDNRVEFDTDSISNYTIFIEGYDSEGNSLFKNDYRVVEE